MTPDDKTNMVAFLQSLVQAGVSEDTLRALTALPPLPATSSSQKRALENAGNEDDDDEAPRHGCLWH